VLVSSIANAVTLGENLSAASPARSPRGAWGFDHKRVKHFKKSPFLKYHFSSKKVDINKKCHTINA